MLSQVQNENYLKRFSTIESSFRVEGMDPSGDPIYEEAKASILSGKLTAKEALDFVCSQTAALHESVAMVSS